MILLQMILMAILQGVTEFLPISSSGHLAFLNLLFSKAGLQPLEEQLLLGIVLHFASLLAIVCFYWRHVLRLVFGRDMRLLKLLVLGTIPIGIVGVTVKLFFDAEFERLLGNVQVTGAMMLVTAILLLFAQKMSRRAPKEMHQRGLRRNLKTLSGLQAFGIGCVQALAILPGLSRSGSTITAGLFSGLKRQDAGTFSFLLAIPAISAASGVEFLHILKNGVPESIGLLPLLVAFFVCFIVSLFSLVFLIRILRSRRLGFFAFYLVPVGILMLILAR